MKFKYGFWHKDFLYGWYQQELYRLPSNNGNKNYGLKKLNPIKVGNKSGYRVKRDKLTIDQLEEKTIVINQEISKIEDKDLPFKNGN